MGKPKSSFHYSEAVDKSCDQDKRSLEGRDNKMITNGQKGRGKRSHNQKTENYLLNYLHFTHEMLNY